jgi:hypothetical protein
LTEGTTPAVAVLATLATLALVLPQFTPASEGPTFSVSALAFAGAASRCGRFSRRRLRQCALQSEATCRPA